MKILEHKTALVIAATAACHGAFGQTAPAAGSAPATTEDELILLTPFEVSASQDRGYQATQTLAGTRIRTELRDVGAAISVVTRDLMDDIGATDNSTLLQYTTNAEVAGTRGTYAGLGNGTSVDEMSSLRNPGQANRVRGLSNADNTRDFFVSDIPWDGYNVDRIDIQRGPNSILFGLGKPAGIVNATIRNAEFRNRGDVQFRVGSYGSLRGSLDVNQELIDNVLAIRLDGLWDQEKFRQDYTFEDDERISGALRWDPQLFKNRTWRTSIRAKFEHGEIEANRPRIVPPNDHISPWFRPTAVSATNPFGGMNKLLLGDGYMAEREDNPPVGGDNMGQTRQADPDYNAWVQARGNQQQPFYFYDGGTGALENLYGGYINKGARNADGTIRSASSSLVGLRYSGVLYGIAGLPQYATNARLPGYQYGQYREMSLTDPSVFDFYNTLIDGPNKAEWEDWDSYNINLSQTAFDDRIAVEFAYDRQDYNRGGESLLGYAPTLDIDILRADQDLTGNPDLGRPYVQAAGSGSSYASKREYARASLFAEFRASDVIDNGFLQKLIGKHRFNGVFSDEKFRSENRTWQLYATSAEWDAYTGTSLAFNDRPPLGVIYLGNSIANNGFASNSGIPGISSTIDLDDGELYHFSSEWTGGTNYGDPWTVPAELANVYNFLSTQPAPAQNSNPANYRGWNRGYDLNIDRYRDGDESLTTNAAKALRKTKSYAGTWQSFWWDGGIVGTLGWRYDAVQGKDVAAPANQARSKLNLSPEVYTLPDAYNSEVKDHSLSWGVVAHLNRLLPRDPLPFDISLTYNTSENFEIAGTRRNMFGEVIGNPTGETEDIGILLSTKDQKYSVRVVKYEAKVTGSSTPMSNLNAFGDIISYGLRWRNVFLYNLNTYTLDSANGSNEWRYNFDPDTAAGETQEQATARENASIAAWNGIQQSLPKAFYDYWGFTPQSNFESPDPAQVTAYKLWGGAATPPGLTMTSDTVSEGYEFELTANPTPNWRVSFNAAKTEATRNNVGSQETVDFVNYMNEQMAGPAGEMRMFSGGPTAQTLRQQWNSTLGSWVLLKLQEGAMASEIRPWRFNFITNYSIRNGMLKGLSVGGSYRWEDKAILGYPVVARTPTEFTFDLDQPYYGPAEDAVDLWVGYERKLTNRLGWKIQLNVRNAFADDGLIPISVQPDGKTWATVRVKPVQEWFVTNTLTF